MEQRQALRLFDCLQVMLQYYILQLMLLTAIQIEVIEVTITCKYPNSLFINVFLCLVWESNDN